MRHSGAPDGITCSVSPVQDKVLFGRLRGFDGRSLSTQRLVANGNGDDSTKLGADLTTWRPDAAAVHTTTYSEDPPYGNPSA